jgi:hypothetical protein
MQHGMTMESNLVLKLGLKVLELENRSFLDWVVFGFSFTQLGSGEFLSFVLSLKSRSKNHHKSWEGL